MHNLHGYYINIEILFNYLSEYNKKVVWTLHDCWAFTGHCPHFDLVNCNKWETGCFNCPRKSDYPASYIVDNSKNNYEKKKKLFTSIKNMTIITPSEWLANLVQKSYLGKYSINVINNGIDLSAFKPTESSFKTEYNIQNKKIILGVASRWGVHKGLNDFIKLSSMLDDNYKIVLVGLSKKQIKLMPENIICISKTDSIKQLAQIYTAADIFVNLTYEDNYPTVNLEALACGTPVITYQTGGSVECINDACGMSVKKGDLDSALNAIKHICQDPRSIIKDSCIINAKKYDKKETYNKYINLYKNRI